MCDAMPGKTIVFVSNDPVYLFRFRGPLIEAFRRRGYSVYATAPAHDGVYEARIEALGATFIPWPLNKTSQNPLAELASIAALYRIIKPLNADIVFAYTVKPVIYGLIAAWLAGVPRRVGMITGLGYAFVEGKGVARKLLRQAVMRAYAAAFSVASEVIFQNEDDIAQLRTAGLLKPTTPVSRVNGSGVDMDHYSTDAWPEGAPRFLMMARLLWDKGVGEFIAAARIVRREFPDARFTLVGEGDSNPAAVSPEQVQAWVDEGLIQAPGRLADPRPAFADAHIFVLPSYYMEGCPRVNLEALSMARPIITTDWVGCRETVVDGLNGRLIPVRDTEALAQAMLDMARDLPRARALGQAGRDLCRQRFELGAVTRATVDLIEGACCRD